MKSFFVSREKMEDITEHQLMKRAVDPDEISNMIIFLLSDESSLMTGEVYPVSGGWNST